MANQIEYYVDGQGNQLAGVEWDGDPVTAETIKAWSGGMATVDRRGVLGALRDGIRHHVGIGDWVCMDANRRVFALSGGQMKASYKEAPGPSP